MLIVATYPSMFQILLYFCMRNLVINNQNYKR